MRASAGCVPVRLRSRAAQLTLHLTEKSMTEDTATRIAGVASAESGVVVTGPTVTWPEVSAEARANQAADMPRHRGAVAMAAQS